MSDWKPGDVAAITYGDGQFTDVAVRIDPRDWSVAAGTVRDAGVTEAHPLVVIDPEDREQVARLADAFCSARWSHQPDSEECDPLTRSSMREALRVYLAGPKPDEPTGLGAVVEDANGLLWLRTDMCRGRGANSWSSEDGSHDYTAIAAVRVLSEGVTR